MSHSAPSVGRPPTPHRRSCHRCGWAGTYNSPKRGDYAKRQHSCEKWAAKLAGQQRRVERLAQVDRSPKPCLHKVADHQHGTRAAYVLDKCRCFPCATANAQAESHRERQKVYGRYDKYVEAEPVREHVRALMAKGMGWKRVAAAARVPSSSMWKLLYGKRQADGSQTPSRRTTRTNAERLLSVTLDLADGAKVDATGTTRRIRALVALGWSQSRLAERLGIQRSNFDLATGTLSHVLAGTARAVESLYDDLSMTLPPAATHREKISVSRARGYAKDRGWLPPLALDDERLDDPTYEPGSLAPDVDKGALDEAAIYRRMHGDRKVRLTKAEGAELVRRWEASGRPLAECERVTGLNPHRYPRTVVDVGEATA